MKRIYNATSRNIKVLLGNMATLLVAIAMTAPLNAQVTVTQKGNLKVGELVQEVMIPDGTPARSTATDAAGIIMPPGNYVYMDSLATLCLLGPGAYSSGAYVTFGNEKKVW